MNTPIKTVENHSFNILNHKNLYLMEDLIRTGLHISKDPIIALLPNTPSHIRKNEIPQFSNQCILGGDLSTSKQQPCNEWEEQVLHN